MFSLGKRACNIPIPSNGGIGIKLKKASETFTIIIVKIPSIKVVLAIPCKRKILRLIPAINAMRRFVRIPAEATNARPRFVRIL